VLEADRRRQLRWHLGVPPGDQRGGSLDFMAEKIELSQGARDRLQAEYDDLIMRGRAEIARLIERAREMGDLSENGDYHAAKDDQGKMEARIRQLKAMLDRAVVKETSGGGGVVASGSVVEIRYEGDDDTERYLIGSIEERHEELAVISPGSPLGRAVMGCVVGDTVEYEAPGGVLKVEIIGVS
jgi:transcription elongation factor GreA